MSRLPSILRVILCFAPALLLVASAQAQGRKAELSSEDKAYLQTPFLNGKNIPRLTAHVIRNCDTDEQKVRAIYTWVAYHIKYDLKRLRKGKPIPPDPRKVLGRRKAVCEGFTELFAAMCSQAGVACVSVPGYSKGMLYREGQRFLRSDHVWNAVYINGEWQLLDVTWGSGTVVRKWQLGAKVWMKITGRPYLIKLRMKRGLTYRWLHVDPAMMVADHLPSDPIWQLLDTAVAENNFESVLADTVPDQGQVWEPPAIEQLPLIREKRAEITGEDARHFHFRNEFELALGRLQLGMVALKTLPGNPADTLVWQQGLSVLDSVPPAVARWKPIVNEEYRTRLRELAQLRQKCTRVFLRQRGNVKSELAQKRLPAKRRRTLDRIEEKEQKERAFAAVSLYKPILARSARPDPARMKAAETKVHESLEQLAAWQDSLIVQNKRLQETGSRLCAQGEDISALHQRSLQFIAGETQLYMCGLEYRESLDIIPFGIHTDTLCEAFRQWMHTERTFWIQRNREMVIHSRICAGYRKANVCMAGWYAAGASAQSCDSVRDSVSGQYNRWEQQRIGQWEVSHKGLGDEDFYIGKWKHEAKTIRRKLHWLEYISNKYLRAETAHTQSWVRNEVRLYQFILRQNAASRRTLRSRILEARRQKR